MVHFGLDVALHVFPESLRRKRLGVLCHAASVTAEYVHVLDALLGRSECTLAAIFGPQHGLFGQTQDNMIEWEGGYEHPRYRVPVYSLYGATRRPTPAMLAGIDCLLIDLQDVGARPYTYIWTIKECMAACTGAGIPVVVFDRPNPISALPMDGPMLSSDFFSFVGGMEIPLCHRLTMGELSLLLKETFFPALTLEIIWMRGWWRDSLWHETGLPWVLPSPNMPTEETAIVYPGMVLLEATNLSEGRGTTRPFEIFGAPYLKPELFIQTLGRYRLSGCLFREHSFQPTFQKWKGEPCWGMQIHVTDRHRYLPVYTAVCIIAAALQAGDGGFGFKNPPYEYERKKMPFDILAGDESLRHALLADADLRALSAGWQGAYAAFIPRFQAVCRYPEKRP
jgi:uncharacterized protein YbbC (DUF1343 family)